MDLRQQLIQDLLGRENIVLSEDQEEALKTFSYFMDAEEERATFLLTGSAGTGKTFLINLLTLMLRRSGYKVVLLAPTGRAAKVITRSTKRLAFTIHHHIYSPLENAYGDVHFVLKANKELTKTVYVVDEASMIGDQTDGSTPGGLLDDLAGYVFGMDPYRKLVLVGDPVQLPPVGHSESPALDAPHLENKTDLSVYHTHLTDVKRQINDSNVLENAVRVRDAFLNNRPQDLEFNIGREVQVLENPWEALETYMGYYQEGNPDRVVFLTYSNYQAVRVNQAIRHQLLETEELLIPGDLLMVVKNNYAWGDSKRMPFIANGEMCTVREVMSETYEERYGLKWVNASLEFLDRKGELMLVECKLVLDLLQSKTPQLDHELRMSIMQERRHEYIGMSKAKVSELLRSDPYLNALQVKYGYAITGHKSQGGQWQNVLIGFEPDYGNNILAYIRWTYTTLTRAEDRVFVLRCPFVEAY
ncbi:MAG: AAA family ATPase [Bacteroidota bacterium]